MGPSRRPEVQASPAHLRGGVEAGLEAREALGDDAAHGGVLDGDNGPGLGRDQEDEHGGDASRSGLEPQETLLFAQLPREQSASTDPQVRGTGGREYSTGFRRSYSAGFRRGFDGAFETDLDPSRARLG